MWITLGVRVVTAFEGYNGAKIALAGVCLLMTGCSTLFGEREGVPTEETRLDTVNEAPPSEVSIDTAWLEALPEAVRPHSSRVFGRPGAPEALRDLAEERPRQAALRLETLRRDNGRDLDLGRLHAWALLRSGEAKAAESVALELAETTSGPDAGLSYISAKALVQQERPRAALPHFKAAVSTKALDPDLLEEAAYCAHAAEDPAYTLYCLDRLGNTRVLSSELSLLRARAQARSGNGNAALGIYDRMLNERAEDAALWDEAGLVAFDLALKDQGRAAFDQAADYLSKSSGLDPQNARYHFNLGCALDWGERTAAAEAAYQRALELHPGYLSAAENLVGLLIRLDRSKEAEHILRQLLRQPLEAEQVTELESRLHALEAGLELPERANPKAANEVDGRSADGEGDGPSGD